MDTDTGGSSHLQQRKKPKERLKFGEPILIHLALNVV